MKYILYRFPDAIEWKDEDKPHLKAGFHFPVQPELTAIEYGKNIYDVTNTLIRAITYELSGTKEYSHFRCDSYPPDTPYILKYMTDMKFDYEMQGLVYGHEGYTNTIIYFGVKEIDKE